MPVYCGGRLLTVEVALMFGDGPLSFREFVMNEPLPLAIVHTAVLEFLRGKDDAILFGAQAVNAYVRESRATQDVDIMSPRAAELAEEIRVFLNSKFHVATRVRNVRDGLGFRVYQIQKSENRHLVDVRPITDLPPTMMVKGVRVVAPAELVAQKLLAWGRRGAKAKGFTDRRDLAVLLLQFPDLKSELGPVHGRLVAAGADAAAFESWRQVVATTIEAEADEDEFQ